MSTVLTSLTFVLVLMVAFLTAAFSTYNSTSNDSMTSFINLPKKQKLKEVSKNIESNTQQVLVNSDESAYQA